ncbi:hypothetical protein HD554DRAFT_2177189 [Boletus coccyginus]|nr:hypothetical protein HD554DRAFT_2177189 [Boletus coccyginus]
MPANLASGRFKIVSLTEGERPTSVNYTEPGSQIVRLGQPVNVWEVNLAADSGGILRLSIGGYRYSGVIDDKVTASINPEVNVQWFATYRENHDAYTISPLEDTSKGWTVPPILSIHPEIEIGSLIPTTSLSPQFPPSQLYKFVPVPEE